MELLLPFLVWYQANHHHTLHFNSCFPGKPGIAGIPLICSFFPERTFMDKWISILQARCLFVTLLGVSKQWREFTVLT